MTRAIPAILPLLALSTQAAEPPQPPWKNIALGDNATLSFDGSLRERYEWSDQRDLGVNGGGREDSLMQRLLIGSRFDYADHFGAYLQLGSSLSTPRDHGRKPTDEDHAYLGQGYVDFRLPTAYGLGTLRVGRQEIALGSLHLMGTRDGANVRRAFDAVRASWVKDKRRLDAFIAHPVTIKKGSFDDDTDNGQKIWSLYGTTPLNGLSSSIDLYYFGFEDNDAHYTQGSGQERRYTLGSRIFGAANGFDWDNEAAWQFGSFEQRDIRAWSASAHGGYTLDDWRWKPRIGGKIGIASGDKNSRDGQLNTFNAMYPKMPYLTENGLVKPANLIAVQPSLTVTPWQTVSIELSWNAMWRQRQDDGFYLGAVRPVKDSNQGSRFIGYQYQISSTWTPKNWLQFKVAWVYFDVGDSLKQHTSLKDMNFVLTQGTVSF